MRGSSVIVIALTAAVTLVAACGRRTAERTPPVQRPSILLLTIDTFRADRLGVGVSPTLDRLAASGVRFTAARTTVPLTLPSHTTILTGLLPPAHGVRENGSGRLSDSQPTLARLLKTAGYRTAAFVGAFVLDRRFGLDAGFAAYDDRIPRDPDATDRLEAERPASAVVDAALAWFEADPKGPSAQPFFVWIHLYDPHAPYTPPPEFLARVEQAGNQRPNPESPSSRSALRRGSPKFAADGGSANEGGRILDDVLRYDGEIAYVDSQIARVLDWLRGHALADRTLIAIAGDHGEGLGDHGEHTHGMLLYDSTLRVPLVLAVPGRAPGVRHDAVSLTDVAPTILRAVGVTPPAAMKGRDLLEDRPKANAMYDIYSETEYPRVAGWSPLQALTDGRWMTIRAGSSTEVYDLRNDSGELHNIAVSQAATASAMSSRMDAIRARATHPDRAASPDVQERLRALGYVSSSVQAVNTSHAPNPSTKIDAWNAFEDALSALDAHRPHALPALKRLATAHPDAPVFQTTYARALKEAGKANAALAVYRSAATRWPTDATLLHDLAVAARDAASGANVREARALRDEATRAEEAAIALSPDSPLAHNGLGLIAIDTDRPREAADAFERAATLDPNNASYGANLGNARRALGDRAGAEQAYRRALDVDARIVDAANGLGVLLVEGNRAAEAVPWFERALAAAPDFVEARLNLGIALQQSGETKRAGDTYREVLKSSRRHARERAAAAKLLAALEMSR